MGGVKSIVTTMVLSFVICFLVLLQYDPARDLRPPLTMKWRKGKDMPIKMSRTVQCVAIGSSVYVGGGWADSLHEECTIMEMNLPQDVWTNLPLYVARYFAMTSLNNQLVLVGGQNPEARELMSQIAVFESGKYSLPYPPMSIARHSSAAVSFNHCIIVIGGRDNEGRLSSVEVLDVASRRWYVAESLPNPRSSAKLTLIGNTLYLMGGSDHCTVVEFNNFTKAVHKVDLNVLITAAVSRQDTSTLWQEVEQTPLARSAPLTVGGSLLAVGGLNHDNPSSSIHLYQPDIRRWVKVGELPTARCNCTCSEIPSREVFIAGGYNGSHRISTINFLSIYIS